MLKAHSGNHILSDNALINFGMVHNNVVIIDAGSRSPSAVTKGNFNKQCMRTLERRSSPVRWWADDSRTHNRRRASGWAVPTSLARRGHRRPWLSQACSPELWPGAEPRSRDPSLMGLGG